MVSLEDIQDKLIPISAQSGPTHVIAPLAPSQDTTPDQIAYFNRPNAIPFVRHSPLPAAANAQINATAAATATTIAEQVVKTTPSNIELDIPDIFTPVSQIVKLPGPLSFDLSLETEGTVFAAPIPFIGGYGDTQSLFKGISSDPINVAVTSGGNSEVAIWMQASDGGSLVFTSPWTNWQNNSVASINAQFVPAKGTTISYTGSGGGADYAGILVLLGASQLPAVVQSKTGSTSLTPPGTVSTGNFGSPNTAGNAILVMVAVHNVSGSFDLSGFSVTDTQGNTYLTIEPEPPQNILDTACLAFLCPVIAASAANSVTVHFPAPSGSATVTISALELSAVLEQVSLFPEFIPLTSGFIPPIDLSSVNVNGGITGVLGAADGGTGLSSPGTSGNVLTSNGTGWVSSSGSGITSINSQTGPAFTIAAGSGISVVTTTNTATISGGGGSPGGSTGDIQINNAGSFGVAPTGAATLTGGGLSVTGMAITMNAGAAGNIVIRTNGNLQMDSNGSNVLIGTTFSSNCFLGGTTSNVTVGQASSNLSFYSGTLTAQQTVAGSRSGGAALTNLLIALAAFGLIIDGTTP